MTTSIFFFRFVLASTEQNNYIENNFWRIIEGLVHYRPMSHSDHFLFVLAHIHQSFCLWPWIPSENVAPKFYQLLCASFFDKNGNLAHNHRFLWQTKRKQADKTLEQRFLKEFKATCKNSVESELKQQQQQQQQNNLKWSVMHWAFQETLLQNGGNRFEWVKIELNEKLTPALERAPLL